MSLLTLIAATVMMDDIKRIEREKEQKRIQDAKDRADDRLRRKIRILKEEFGEDAVNKIKF
nr:MAG TPA: hypothetical protein [Caudoviricetes sp.]DAU73285.1 MAG TPA: hypothetical protein [Caudoviricetes sp.]